MDVTNIKICIYTVYNSVLCFIKVGLAQKVGLERIYPTYTRLVTIGHIILTFFLALYLTHILTFYEIYYVAFYLAIYSDILSGILSDICSEILSGFLFGI